MSHTVSLQHELSTEFLSDVLIAAFDGGYGGSNYWLKSFDHLRKSEDGEQWLEVVVTPEDYDDPDAPRSITHGDLARGIQTILDTRRTDWFIFEYVNAAVTEDDAGHIDAEAADVIVQYATFSEIVYG